MDDSGRPGDGRAAAADIGTAQTADAGIAELADAGTAAWRRLLLDGHEPLRRAHRMFKRLPGPPRCKLCHNPFGGPGGRVLRLAGFRPSRKNPNLCARCCDTLPAGGVELDVAVLFADVRGSTALCEQIGAAAFAKALNRFYYIATEVLIGHDAIIDKLIGDEVMALFIPGVAGATYRGRAAAAAIDLIENVTKDIQLPVGAAVDAGPAYMGNVGGEGVTDFTALGDPVNTAARLQATAAPGQVVLTADIYASLSEGYPGAEARTVNVRGREAPIPIQVLSVATAPV